MMTLLRNKQRKEYQALEQWSKETMRDMKAQIGKAVGGVVKSGGEKYQYKELYVPVIFNGTVKVNGEVRDVSRKVYQRQDININYFDTSTGMTNIERMKTGKPPIGFDGKPIELHHIIQKEKGPMVELVEITHKQYYRQLHGLVGKNESFRNNPVLAKQYANFRYNYWKWRASQIEI